MISKIIMSGCLLLSVISIKFDICLDTLYFDEKHRLYILFIAISDIHAGAAAVKSYNSIF